MPLAVFDLDETLIAPDSDREWGVYVCDRGLVNADEYRRRNDAFYEDYLQGRLDIHEYLAFVCDLLHQHPMDELHRFREEFIRERIEPGILDKARDLVNDHRERGDVLLVITATIEFVTRPIVDMFSIDTLIAPELEIVDNRYTGRVLGTPSFAEGKVTRLQAWLDETGHSLAGSHFYSDSHNDLPLLRLVDHPVAVDPDPTLRTEAEKLNWRIISLR